MIGRSETMTSNAFDVGLPPPSAGWQVLAWQGFSLSVPDVWNVTYHREEDKAGALALADLRGVRLEIRWQVYRRRSLARTTAKMLRRLDKRGAKVYPLPEPLPEGLTGYHVVHEQASMVLLVGPRRIYELNWPEAAPNLQPIALSFHDHSPAEQWPWQIYGATGLVPRNFKLKKIVLQPGGTRLEFRRYGRQIVVGSWSMAQRLLGDKSLQEFAQAQIPLVKNNPAGVWQEQAGAATFQVRKTSLLLRRRQTQTLFLNHHSESNTIRWRQEVAPAGKVERRDHV